MLNSLRKFCVPVFLSFLLTSSVFAEETKPISLSSLPAPVQRTVQNYLADGKLEEIEKIDANGESIYQIILTKGEDERTLKIDNDGTLLSLEIGLSEAPPAVRAVIEKQVGKGTLDSINKTFATGKTNYDVDFTTFEGVERSFSMAPDGKVERFQVLLAEVPAAVKKTIEQNSTNAFLGDIFRTFTDGVIAYDVDITRAGKERDFIVSADGKLESKEMFLAELPEGARKTIKEKIGNGKILRIDESFEKRNGIFPFEVEGFKDGKPFNFTVGPKGRFFGMDE